MTPPTYSLHCRSGPDIFVTWALNCTGSLPRGHKNMIFTMPQNFLLFFWPLRLFMETCVPNGRFLRQNMLNALGCASRKFPSRNWPDRPDGESLLAGSGWLADRVHRRCANQIAQDKRFDMRQQNCDRFRILTQRRCHGTGSEAIMTPAAVSGIAATQMQDGAGSQHSPFPLCPGRLA